MFEEIETVAERYVENFTHAKGKQSPEVSRTDKAIKLWHQSVFTQTRGVFRILSNIYEGAFLTALTH